jgi:hypothetical protein
MEVGVRHKWIGDLNDERGRKCRACQVCGLRSKLRMRPVKRRRKYGDGVYEVAYKVEVIYRVQGGDWVASKKVPPCPGE